MYVLYVPMFGWTPELGGSVFLHEEAADELCLQLRSAGHYSWVEKY